MRMPMAITDTTAKAATVRIEAVRWLRRSEPAVWLSGGAVIVAVLLLVGLLGLLAVRGLPHFWPAPLLLLNDDKGSVSHLGKVLRNENGKGSDRLLLDRGGEEFFDSRLVWVALEGVGKREYPVHAVVLERSHQGPLYGFMHAVYDGSRWSQLSTLAVQDQLTTLRELRRAGQGSQDLVAGSSGNLARVIYRVRLGSGRLVDIPATDVSLISAPNAMTVAQRTGYFFSAMGRFLTEAPRRGNALGGVFPAIVGTVTLVLLMTAIVSPLGVLAAIFLQEYAQRGPITRVVRIAVNNLAGVPSIVYGVFGLGFFVYSVGGSLDSLFFSDSLPAPTLGSPGMLWAALTMALLTLPVVIVSTEEGLARVPSSLREGSLALGATRAETLWRVVLPAASPAVLTGLILAVARATGEVAPLLLVGVAKYAPGLPVTTDFPYLHLDRQFMHLGFYIYDLGFQSPDIESSEGLVYATALLLVVIVVLLNLAAVMLRGRLREAFTPQEGIL